MRGEKVVTDRQSPDQNSKFLFENSLRNSDFDNPKKLEITFLKLNEEKGKKQFQDKDKIMFHRSKIFKMKEGSLRTLTTFAHQQSED